MITFALLIIIGGISLVTMNDNNIKQRFMFNAYAVSRHREWWRFFTHGALHADFMHLFFNMLSFYFFGPFVEKMFCHPDYFGPEMGRLVYILLFIGALPVSCIFTYFKQKDNAYYNALGASGAVSAIIFASILLNPLSTIYVYVIPVPAWLYGPIFLLYSSYASRRGGDNIGHDAHFWGAVYGFVLPLCFDPTLLRDFIWKLKLYFGAGI